MPAAQPKVQRISNEAAFDRYRKIIELDTRNATTLDQSAGDFTVALCAFGAWGGRYSRRRYVLEGTPGYADPLADEIACRLVIERNRRIDRDTAMPDWEPDVRGVIEMGLKNSFQMTLAEPHAYGPSLRRLWAEASDGGLSGFAAWEHVVAWAQQRPAAFSRDAERLRRKKPVLGAEQARLERPLAWESTGDPDLPWAAEVDGSRWQVRLNDFPDAFMYSLIVDGEEIGDFHDWPAGWAREGQPAAAQEAPAASARAPKPLLADAAGRWPERYTGGECVRVWAEMVALGPDVQSAVTLAPARAVAKETMRRARHNIKLIVPRLRALGYDFYKPVPPSNPLGSNLLVGAKGFGVVRSLSDVLKDVLQEGFGHMPPQAREQLGGARESFLKRMQDPQSLVADMIAKVGGKPAASPGAVSPEPSVFEPAPKGSAAQLARLERRGLILPLSLASWIAEVGRIDLTGSHPALSFMHDAEAKGIYADPLSVIPMADDVEEQAEDWQKSDGERSIALVMGLLPADKAALGSHDDQIDDGYEIAIPDPGADAPLQGQQHGLSFVEYLRLAFLFGGFPGWAGRPNQPAELKALTKGLVPI